MKLLNLNELNHSDISITGGKAATLGELINLGINVPPGFVIPTEIFNQFLEVNKLREEISKVNFKDTEHFETISKHIQSLILQAEIPFEIEQTIIKEFTNLNIARAAVRSSATVEDSKEEAWAGQLETYLNTSEDTLIENIKKCWASLFSPRALTYRQIQKLDNTTISVAVIVQQMVGSEVAGVAFSLNPVTNNSDQLVIEAVAGLGDTLVSGEVTPQSFIVDKNSWEIIETKLNQEEQLLSKKQLLELADLVLKIEQHFDFPVDVEWAFTNNQFYILQSRPITTLNNNSTPNTVDWIYQGIRETPILEANMKFVAWGRKLKQEIGVGFTHFIITNKGEHYQDNNDLNNILTAIESLPKNLSYLQKMRHINTMLLAKLQSNEFHWEEIIQGLIDQLTAFYIARMQADTFFTNPETSQEMKQEIIKWRNDIHLFSAYDEFLAILSKKYKVKEQTLDMLTIEEMKSLITQENINWEAIEQRIKSEWSIVLNGTDITLTNTNEKPDITEEENNSQIISGNSVMTGLGKIKGIVGTDILVIEMSRPEMITQLKRYKAVITNQGGLLSHAAVTCRELGIPCVIGTMNATSLLKEGTLVEINTDTGKIRIIDAT